MSKDMVDEKSSVIKKNLLELNILNNGNSIAAFSSFQNEPQTEELINYLWSEEKEVYLPVTHKGSLKFYNCLLYTSPSPRD